MRVLASVNADLDPPVFLLHDLIGRRDPQIRLAPTGGVNLDTIEAFLAAGSDAVGVGSALVKKSALKSGNMDEIRDTAAAFVERVAHFRQGQ